MITTEQVAAANTFLLACEPANSLRRGPTTQSLQIWQNQLEVAQEDRRVARGILLDLCGTRTVYKEAIAAAQEKRKLV
jgi:hypothetical protein